jgi:hypothetical protein
MSGTKPKEASNAALANLMFPLAPGKHFKPLQRYNACGTGTFWQFGNRYTETM